MLYQVWYVSSPTLKSTVPVVLLISGIGYAILNYSRWVVLQMKLAIAAAAHGETCDPNSIGRVALKGHLWNITFSLERWRPRSAVMNSWISHQI